MKNLLPRYLLSLIVIFSMCTSFIEGQTVHNNLPQYEKGIIYLKIKDSSKLEIDLPIDNSTESLVSLGAIFKEFDVTRITKPFGILEKPRFQRIYRVYFNRTEGIDLLIRKLNVLPFVEFSEKIPLNFTQPNIPNDPSVPIQSYQLGLINAFDAFDIHTGGGAVVAIVDDAVLTTHEDLAGNLVNGWDAADLDNDPNPPLFGSNAASPSKFTHGTHVAGIAGAVNNNNLGTASVGWNNKMMPIKAIRDNTFSTNGISHGFDGIAWATANGADVINLSWGGTGYSQADYMVIENAWQSGIILVVSAGNSFSSTPFYPAAYGEGTTGEIWELANKKMVIAVASIDANGDQSNWGSNFMGQSGSNFGPWVDISAYGTSIYSTLANSSSGLPINNTYGNSDGTSMAAPLVAGLAGLMVSYRPSASANDIISCLLSSSNSDIYDAVNHPNNLLGTLGSGRINANDALRCLGDGCNNPVAFIYPSSSTICPGGSVILSANNGDSYSWSNGATTQTININTAGTYSVTVTFGGGACSTSTSITVNPSNPNAIMLITDDDGPSNDGITCGVTGSDLITLTPMWGNSYLWSFNNYTTPSLSVGGGVNLPFNYTYSVTVTDVGGCAGVTDVLSGNISWIPDIVTDLQVIENSGIPNNNEICKGDEAELIASGGTTYLWSTGQTTNSITVNYAGTYSVTISDGLCTNIETATISFQNFNFDLMVTDDSGDTGMEPNNLTGIWNGAIWNCDDNVNPCYTMVNPEYKALGGDNFLKVNVTNLGPERSCAARLHLYWTIMRTDEIWPTHWLDPIHEPTNKIGVFPAGGEITVNPGSGAVPLGIPLQNILPGSTVTKVAPWKAPNPADFGGGTPMICFLARIVSHSQDNFYNEQYLVPISHNVLNNNNIATINTNLVDLIPTNTVDVQEFTFYINNNLNEPVQQQLNFYQPSSLDGNFFKEGSIQLSIGDGKTIRPDKIKLSQRTSDSKEGIYLLTGEKDKYTIDNIHLEPKESVQVNLLFQHPRLKKGKKEKQYNLILEGQHSRQETSSTRSTFSIKVKNGKRRWFSKRWFSKN